MSFSIEAVMFVKARRIIWLTAKIMFLFVFGGLFLFASRTAVAPFSYTIV